MSLPTSSNPFVGLRPFESDESLLFFGRQEQTMELLQRLHQHHFVAVVGSSGSGKSSLIRAGLIPRLKAGYLVDEHDKWLITIMKPGQSPLYNLADAIASQLSAETDEANLLKQIKEEGADAVLNFIKHLWEKENTNFFLLIDQFEELFRFAIEQKEAAKKDEAIDFVNIILELSKQITLPIYVVITMRSDFIGDCSQFFGLPEAMNQSQYLVPRLNRVQLKNAIEGPIKLYGGNISAALTSKLLNDVSLVKDELPLLQHALMRIWDHEMTVDVNGELDLDDYEFIGGIEKALSNHADEALKGMSDEEINLTKKIFQALTSVDENGRKIRRPAHLKELEEITGADKEKILTIIKKFIEDKRSFLVINKTGEEDDAVIDISHESLIRQWKTLSDWVDDEDEACSNYLRLVESAELHRGNKKDLLVGSELQIAMNWYDTFKPSVFWAKKYDENFEESVQYLNQSKREWKHQKKAKRLRLLIIVVAVIGLMIYMVFETLSQRKLKNDALAQKNKTQNLYESFHLNALAQEWEDKDPTIALRMEEAAMQKNSDSLFAASANRIYLKNTFYKTLYSDTMLKYAPFAFSPGGTKFLVGLEDGTIKLIDRNGKLLKQIHAYQGSYNPVVFSPDGSKIMVSSDSTGIWDLDGKKIMELPFSRTFSSDCSKLILYVNNSMIRLEDLDGKPLRVLQLPPSMYPDDFSSDGKKMVTYKDSVMILLNLENNHISTFRNPASINRVAFSPDNKKILAILNDNTARLWNTNISTHSDFKGHTGHISTFAFSSDGSKILTGSDDATARLWDDKGRLSAVFKGHQSGIISVALSRDNSKVFTASIDGTVRMWNVPVIEFIGHTNEINLVAYSPDNTKILTGSIDSTARLWDVKGNLLRTFHFADQVASVAFSPDGSRFLTASGDTAILWSLDSTPPKRFIGHTGLVQSVAFSPGNKKILTGSDDGTARLWDMNENDKSPVVFSNTYGIACVAFSPDGSKILTGSREDTAKLWSINDNQKPLAAFKHPGTVYSVAFSPDGTKVLTGSTDGTAILWSLKGDSLRTFKHNDQVESVAFSPDGTKILTSSWDYTIKLWSINGTLLNTFEMPEGIRVRSVTFSPDSKKIFAGTTDGVGRLYDIRTFQEFLKSDELDKLTEQQKKDFGITNNSTTQKHNH